MGTIAEKLQKLLSTKEAIKQAIIGKGVSVLDTDTFSSYADKIAEITTSGGSDVKITDINYLFYGSARLNDNGILSLIESPTSMDHTFANISKDNSDKIETMIKGINTDNVTNIDYLFNVTYLCSMDLSSVNFEKVKSAKYLFASAYFTATDNDVKIPQIGGSNVITLDLSYLFSQSNVSFTGVNKNENGVPTLNFISNNVTNLVLSSVFRYSYLKAIDLAALANKNITNAASMFYGAYNITEVVFPECTFSDTCNMTQMFTNSKVSKVDFSKATILSGTIYQMFYNATYLKEIIGVDFSNRTSASYDPFGSGTTKVTRITLKQGSLIAKDSASAAITLNLARMTAYTAEAFEETVGCLGDNTSGYVRTIKLNTTLYNSLTDEQKALATDKGYTLAYGTS